MLNEFSGSVIDATDPSFEKIIVSSPFKMSSEDATGLMFDRSHIVRSRKNNA